MCAMPSANPSKRHSASTCRSTTSPCRASPSPITLAGTTTASAPGGGIYEKISSALIASKSSFAFIFKWDNPRADAERDEMARYVRTRLISDMRTIDFSYGFDIDALADSQLAEIKRIAADLFYRHQLFRTTF